MSVMPIIRCKTEGCTGSAADSPARGPYAKLCKDCRKKKGEELSQRGREAMSGLDTGKHREESNQTMDSALKALTRAARQLERAAEGEAAAKRAKQTAILDFNAAIRAVNEQAHKLLNARTSSAARVEERMERELQNVEANGHSVPTPVEVARVQRDIEAVT